MLKGLGIKDYFYYRKLRSDYTKAIEYNKANNIKDNSPLALYIMVEQFDCSNKGKPYFHCHIHKVDKPLSYKAIFHAHEYNLEHTHYLGAYDWLTLATEKRAMTLDRLGKFEPDMPCCIDSIENEPLFSCQMLPNGMVEISDISEKFIIQHVFVRTDFVTNQVKYGDKVFRTQVNLFSTIK